MKLNITLYRPSGKFYASHVVDMPDANIWDVGFLQTLRENLPGTYYDGYVVVTDACEGQGFHNALFTWSAVFPEIYCGHAIGDMMHKRVYGEIAEAEYQAWYATHCARCPHMKVRCTDLK